MENACDAMRSVTNRYFMIETTRLHRQIAHAYAYGKPNNCYSQLPISAIGIADRSITNSNY